MNGTTILVGDCRQRLAELPERSVQTCVTSPPYFGLRDYGVDGQIGLEATVEAYVAELVDVFRGVRRALRDDGTLWLNLGDSYAAQRGGTHQPAETLAGGVGGYMADGDNVNRGRHDGYNPTRNASAIGLKHKDLIGVPWRVAFALQADGWYLRSDIIWHKPNPMPESVTDRPTKAHEYLFLLAKSDRYFYDADAIAEAAVGVSRDTDFLPNSEKDRKDTTDIKSAATGASESGRNGEMYATRNKRTVWSVALRPFSGAHFATFPPDLIEPCVKAGTSDYGECADCGMPWERETERVLALESGSGRSGRNPNGKRAGGAQISSGEYDIRMGPVVSSRTTRWMPTCDCGAPAVPQRVLDPFGGAGTTALVSNRLQRDCVLLELNPSYAQLAKERIERDAPMFAKVELA